MTRILYLTGLFIAGWATVPSAWAQDAACCLRGTTQATNAINAVSKDQDERFFSVSSVSPNLMFLFDNSCSMNDLPLDPSAVRSSGTRCNNPVYDAILQASGFDQVSGNHPPPDLGVAPCPGSDCWSGDPGFPNLFLQDRFYREGQWTRDNATSYTAEDACSSVTSSRRAECKTCVETKGYYLDPGSSSSSRQIFSGKFLNVYPPKYVAARTVLKKSVWNTKNVRMGVTIFNSSSTGGTLLSPLKPNCDKLDEPTHPDWNANRQAIVTAVNGLSFSTNTPLAEALLDIGQHFTSNNSVFDGWFGNGWNSSGFQNAPLDSDTRSVCFGCQLSNTVIITDGAPCSDNCVPQCIKSSAPPRCPGCDVGCGCGGSCPSACGNGGSCSSAGGSNCCSGSTNYLDSVAKWLYVNDLQTIDPPGGGWSAAGRQRMSTYTVGFGIDHPLLSQTALVAGGQYFTANDIHSLQSALTAVINDVSKRSTTFGVSTISALQTSTGNTAFVPRFIPGASDEAWKGLLFRFDLESELTNGCEEASPPHPKDLDKDGKCNTLAYIDRDGDVVEEDNVTGNFIKRSTGTAARPFWEAGRELAHVNPTYSDPESAPRRDPDSRNLWTVIDSNSDGRFDRLDTMIEFKAANAAQLMKYMAISPDVSNDQVCLSLRTSLGLTAPVETWGEECARIIIEYYRGKQSTELDPARRTLPRAWILGDIFHSSPVLVEPPVAEEACPFFRGQCVASLFNYAGQVDDSASAAYRDYVTGATGPCGAGVPCERRRALVLVGSNGGFLHAFDSGGPRTPLAREKVTDRLQYLQGTGEEVWGFVPPDLLGVMKNFLGQGHGYFVDGTAMVRDVWVDDPVLGQGDGKKSASEFRTVAVVGERGGGQHFFALDLTKNVDGLSTKRPEFLWMWPQPCDPDAALVGETWSNFHPKPPPIGPVVLDATQGPMAGYPGFDFKYRAYNSVSNTWDPKTTKAAERWVVMLNGGYDRSLVRGRGFAMLDVYTGKALWREFYNPSGTSIQQSLEYPVQAGVAMLDVGPGELASGEYYDGYFDTANFGDLGGTLWMARFYEPGKLDNAQRVTNWHLARAFQSNKADGSSVMRRRPISFISSNALQPSTGYLRTYFGTGDRNALLDSGGGLCSMDNLAGCLAMGCRVSTRILRHNGPSGDFQLSSTWNAGGLVSTTSADATCVDAACFDGWRQSCSAHCTETSCSVAAPCPSCLGREACGLAGRSSCAAGSCPATCAESRVYYETVVESCPNAISSGPATLRRDVQYGCTETGGGSTLDCRTVIHAHDINTRSYVSGAVSGLTPHRYVGVHTFGAGSPSRVFSDQASALTFDGQRRTEADLAYLGTLSVPSGNLGTDLGPGWYLDYDQPDERTASAAGLTFAQGFESGCVLWNTMSPNPYSGLCSGVGNQSARRVQADAITGAGNCAAGMVSADGGTVRYQARTVLTPPPEPTPVLAVSGSEVTYTMVSSEPGRSPEATRTATETDIIQSVYNLELTEADHICRHATGGNTCKR